MAVYATTDDVRLVYPAVKIDETHLERLLNIAEARLLVRVPSIPRRVNAGTLPEDLVTATIVDMVVRVLRNATPSLESTQAAAGSFSYSAKAVPGADRVMVIKSDLTDLLPPDLPGTVRMEVDLWP